MTKKIREDGSVLEVFLCEAGKCQDGVRDHVVFLVGFFQGEADLGKIEPEVGAEQVAGGFFLSDSL